MFISRSIQVSLAAGTMLLAAAGARADDPGDKIYTAPEIVVTATRIAWPVEKTASFITVITKRDIEERHAESVGEILRSVVGLDVVQSGSRGKAASLFIRGANSNHCLVMLDGVPVNDPTTGAFDFSELSPAGIERIEIVRGPHGILYGSNAIGGVVNIITSTGSEGPRRSASLAGGSYRSAEGALSVSGGEKSYHYSYALYGMRTDGLGANDFSRNVALSGAASSRLTSTTDDSVSVRYSAADNGLRGPRFDPDPNAEQSGAQFLVSASYKQFVSDLWSYTLRTSFSSREITWKDPVNPLDTGPFAGAGFSEINSGVKNVAWQNDLRLSDGVWLTSGAEWKEERTTNSGYSPFGTTSFDDRIDNLSVFANGISSFKNLPTVSAGVRLDDHSEFGSVATYKLSLAYPVPRTGTTLKGSAGTGFRAPSLNELYYPGYGNRALAPERTFGYDFGFRQDIGGSAAWFEAAYFANSYRNMITSDPVTWLASNIGKARSSGIELQSSLRPRETVTISGFYAFTRTEDVSTGKELLRRPRHSGGGSAALRRGPFDVVLSASRVGARLDNDFGGPLGEHFSPAYTTIDAAVTFRAGASREIYCKLQNISNERYDEVSGYSAPGAHLTAGTRVDF
ncbi:MAG TPA: TonB-dependent receptor [Candidatus Bathyarchaeia archaeon]|nr:TonB-dependent receptor [Candidatus Bathyarchaeia archaeon]